ncbi:MAG TPA: poly-gamma-glutamate biosynthesis protein PgsC [candidate division WOR-3 bacterium]|uniref:Poly-gamma-glutamate biosynthesis protein PgsC n=1 Tax=candidate division WOR-3 bacterium TaxID=2052148 RepID=A0A9C9JZT7_UNCW3|nr:poly-gamma-glutamate biosynthesis protein PgsC [candidate division WOR-3 bacterium]
MLIEAVGLGMFLSLILTETIGLAAGGIVVPGYIALVLHHPLQVVSTVIAGIITFLCVKLISYYTIIYGRRLLIISILIGYLIAYFTKLSPQLGIDALTLNIETVGYVIPGLIAYWIARQGMIPTLAAMLIVSSLVRFIIIIIHNGVVLP